MSGRIEVITGPMFSGKTEEIIRRAKRYLYAKKNIAAFHHVRDNRFDTKKIISRSGFQIESTPIDSLYSVHQQILDADVVIVDEAQFFTEGLLSPAMYWRSRGKLLLISGLDMDVFGRPFGKMPDVMAVADEVLKLTAVCADCGEDAAISYRLSGEEDQIVVGDTNYIALCWECYYFRLEQSHPHNAKEED